MSTPTLAELQRQFFASIAIRPGAGPEAFDPRLLAVIDPSPTLTPSDRLEIYADMYFARLKDCLAEDFPRTVELLGASTWDTVARGYLAAHLSQHPSVRHVGTHLAAYLAAHPLAGAAPWLPELARFEWARLDVFDRPDGAEPLTGADLAAVDPERWGALRFRTVPGFALFESLWPIHQLWADDAPADVPAQATSVRIWRQGLMVYHSPMGPPEADAMRHLIAGVPFAAICEATAADLSLEEAAPKVVGWLTRWIEDGLLAAPAEW